MLFTFISSGAMLLLANMKFRARSLQLRDLLFRDSKIRGL